MQMIQDVKTNLFQTLLQARGDVLLTLCQRRIFFAGRTETLDILIREDTSDDRRAFVPTHLDAFRMMSEII